MNAKKQHWTLYSITATIVLTIAVQLYWNYNNYLDNKQRVKNEIQNSLDTAIDEYYTDLSKSNFFAIIDYDSINSKSSFLKDFWNEDINSSKSKVSISSIKISSDYSGVVEASKIPKILQQEIQKIKISSDTTKFLKGIQSVAIALDNDEINFTRLDSIFTNQLSKKGIKTPHYLILIDKDIKVGGSNKAKDI